MINSGITNGEPYPSTITVSGLVEPVAYPGTPATEILENIARYPDIYSEWSVNEKVAVEVAIGASLAGSRAYVLAGLACVTVGIWLSCAAKNAPARN